MRFHMPFCVLLAMMMSCKSQGIFADEVERGDQFIDKLLRDMLEENGHEYDPYILEDSTFSFSKKVAFVNVTGEAKLHNGWISGLKSLHRAEHCTVTEENGLLYVTAELGAGVMDCNYDGTVKFMSFGPTINVRGKLSYVETRMEFSVDSKTGKNGELERFVIGDLKGLTVKVTGLGPMNWAMNYFVSSITSMFSGFIKNMIEKTVRNHIASRLPNYQFPVDGSESEVTAEPAAEIPGVENVETLDVLDAQQREQFEIATQILKTFDLLEL